MNRRRGFTVSILLSAVFCLSAQTNTGGLVPNTEDLDKVLDLRQQYEKQNNYYVAPSYIRQHNMMRYESLPMSQEALYWLSWKQDPSKIFTNTISFQDTIIVNPLFMPLLLHGQYLPKDLKLYEPTEFSKASAYDKLSPQPAMLFSDFLREKKLEDSASRYVETHHPNFFRYTEEDLPKDVLKTKVIKKKVTDGPVLDAKNEATPIDEFKAPAKFIPDIRYWTSGFESTIQFAQNYISSNWHNGGNSNVNMTTRQDIQYNYKKDKISFTNELEVKLNLNTLPSSVDTLHSYKVNDDVIRLHSNFGYQAYKNWYYTLDLTVKTQMMKNFTPNSNTILAAFLSPLQVTIGPGMKYELNKTFKDKHKNLKLSMNLAPFAYDFMYSRLKDSNMDLARHGFKLRKDSILPGENKYHNVLHQFGTKMETNLTFNFNRNTSWTSRLYYFTNYQRIVGEFENTLNFQINRFFSTRINVQARFDDGVTKGNNFKNYFQWNELLSFGFNYKW